MNDHELADERIEEFLKNETPLKKKEGQIYSNTAKNFFSKIRALRNRGFSFIQIYKAFEKTGLLPEESNPYSFRQAFVREAAKRDREDELLREIKNEARVLSRENKTTKIHLPAPRTSGVLSASNSTFGSRAGLDVKPDNTFTIRPIDPDDLPDI